jgi:hypothetical protein
MLEKSKGREISEDLDFLKNAMRTVFSFHSKRFSYKFLKRLESKLCAAHFSNSRKPY